MSGCDYTALHCALHCDIATDCDDYGGGDCGGGGRGDEKRSFASDCDSYVKNTTT